MSMTDGDDMDFNFEPVKEGTKKAFDFGKLDMDFSLDGEFGKLSSFKIDMPDLDFSSSPKKTTKSKEKSENEYVKGNQPDKKNEFTFSFDFNGLDDFSLEAPLSKGGNNANREKTGKEVASMDRIDCDDFSRQVAQDNGDPEDAIKRLPPVSEDAPSSKSEDVMNSEGNLDASLRSPPNTEIVVDLIKPKGTQISLEEMLAVNDQEMDHQSILPDKTSNESYDQGPARPDSKSTCISIPVKSANTRASSDLTMSSQESDKELQATEKNSKSSYSELTAKDWHAKPLLIKTSTQASLSEEMDVCSSDRTNNPPSECTITGTLPCPAVLASDTEKLKPQKLPQQLLTDKTSTNSEKNKLGGASSSAGLTLDIADPSIPSAPDTLSTDANYHAQAPRSTSKFFSPSVRSLSTGSTAAKPTLIAYRVPGGNNTKFPMLKETNGGGTTKLSMLGRNREDTKQLGVEERREETAKKLDEKWNSSSKVLVNQDSAPEKTEQNADGDNVFRREVDVDIKITDEIGVNAVSKYGQAMKDGLLLLQSEKQINDPKSSGYQLPPVSTGQETKFSNKNHGKFKDKIPTIDSIPKSNISESNKFSYLKFGKKLAGLPSLRIPGNITTAKSSASPIMLENAKSMGNLERSVRSQSVTEMVTSMGAEKQRPLTPSKKRKLSEAADVQFNKLHPSKRLSPSDNRMAKEVSAREVEDEVHTAGSIAERSRKNGVAEHLSPKFDFHQKARMEELGLVESDANIEKAEACAKELEHICSILKKKHEEAKELVVHALVNNNNLLMLNHPIYEEKIRSVQKFAARVMLKEVKAGI